MDLSSVPTGMWILAGVALVVAALCHWRLGGYWRAVAVSTVATPVVFFLASVVQARGVPGPPYVEPFLLYAAFALLVSLLVGAVFVIARRVDPTRA